MRHRFEKDSMKESLMRQAATADWMDDHPNVVVCGSIALMLSLVIAAGDAGTAVLSFITIVLAFWLFFMLFRWASILALVAAAAVLGATLRLLLWARGHGAAEPLFPPRQARTLRTGKAPFARTQVFE
jgi:cell division protein FtsW (lipid II flippase)